MGKFKAERSVGGMVRAWFDYSPLPSVAHYKKEKNRWANHAVLLTFKEATGF